MVISSPPRLTGSVTFGGQNVTLVVKVDGEGKENGRNRDRSRKPAAGLLKTELATKPSPEGRVR